MEKKQQKSQKTEGYLKIKRKFFWGQRFATIEGHTFSYKKGDEHRFSADL
jgi:hypothetical protein